jgi:hypothetical protein
MQVKQVRRLVEVVRHIVVLKNGIGTIRRIISFWGRLGPSMSPLLEKLGSIPEK